MTGSGTLQIGHVVYQRRRHNLVLLLAAVVALWVGLASYRQMDDRQGVPLREDLMRWSAASEFQPVPGHATATSGASSRRAAAC